MKANVIEETFTPDPEGRFSVSHGGMVSTAFPQATHAGVAMLERGGNAIDAACAAALALGVCEPQASGLGGQSMAIMHFNGKTTALDGSSRIPSLAHPSRISKTGMARGCQATTVPTTVSVLGYLNFHYGVLPWRDIVEPAIHIAQNGYRISPLQSRLQKRECKAFLKTADLTGAEYFLKNGNKPYEPGDLFQQTDLAKTLGHLADHGPKSFYTGHIAETIDAQMREFNGFLRKEDLAWIPWPIERTPLVRRYRKVSLATIPPPAAGRTLLLTLMILNHFPSRVFKKRIPEIYHLMAESFRKAFLHRKQRPFDPQTYPQIKDKISREFAGTLASSIQNEIDPGLPLLDLFGDEGETTHLSVMDAQGNAIGITQSIERVYGSKSAARGLGFLYNNYLMACETVDPGHPYFLRPNGIPWTTVAPTIGFRNRKPWFVLGSPGSERIYSSISQFLINVIDRDMSFDQALLEPRFHCSTGGRISLEAGRFPEEVVNYLEKIGYQMDYRSDWSFYLGAIHGVLARQTGKGFQGVAEVRRDGIAAGP